MDAPSNWTCPVCWQRRVDVACVTPCLHQLCYGCAIWWASKKPSCAVCGNKVSTIRYSVRSEEDYLEIAIPQPDTKSEDDPQNEQESEETVLIPPEYNFPAEVWAAYFDDHPEDLGPLLQWLEKEIQEVSSIDWWEVNVAQCTTMCLLCQHGLDQEALVRELQHRTKGDVQSFVRRLIRTTAAMYGPQIRRQLERGDGCEYRAAASPSPSTSHCQEPPTSSLGPSTRPIGPSSEEPPGSSTGTPEHPGTATTLLAEEPLEQPGRAAAAGPSAQGGDPGHPRKRKARGSPQGSYPPRKRRPRKRRWR